MMLLYRLKSEPIAYKNFGFFTEQQVPEDQLPCQRCRSCGWYGGRPCRSFPTKVDYMGGRCADSYFGGSFTVCSIPVMERLGTEFPELESREVVVKWRGKKRCEEVAEMWPRIDITRFAPGSSVEMRDPCMACGHSFPRVTWPEETVTFGDERGELAYRNEPVPDVPGIRLYASDVDSCRIVSFCDGSYLCTQEVRDFVVGHGWTNVMFMRAGEIVDS